MNIFYKDGISGTISTFKPISMIIIIFLLSVPLLLLLFNKVFGPYILQRRFNVLEVHEKVNK